MERYWSFRTFAAFSMLFALIVPSASQHDSLSPWLSNTRMVDMDNFDPTAKIPTPSDAPSAVETHHGCPGMPEKCVKHCQSERFTHGNCRDTKKDGYYFSGCFCYRQKS